jgi:hypothetical protein
MRPRSPKSAIEARRDLVRIEEQDTTGAAGEDRKAEELGMDDNGTLHPPHFVICYPPMI